MAAKKAVKAETPDGVIRDLIMFVVGTVDYDIAKYYDPATSEDPKGAEREMKQLVASVAKRFDVKRRGKMNS